MTKFVCAFLLIFLMAFVTQLVYVRLFSPTIFSLHLYYLHFFLFI